MTFDSLARQSIERQLLRLTEQDTETDTRLLLFDTEKPADTVTHLPPLKAALHQKSKGSTRQAEQVQESVEQADSSSLTLTDKGEGETHWEGEQNVVQSSSVSKWTDALLGTLGAFTGLLIACILIYVLIKIKLK